VSEPREPMWWEFDPDERPVPLFDPQDPESRSVGKGVTEEAQSIVWSAREAIAREDTDPALSFAGLTPTRDTVLSVMGRRVGLVAAGLLAVGCMGSFALGWRQGSMAARPSSSSIPGDAATPAPRAVMKVTSNRHRAESDTRHAPGFGESAGFRGTKEVRDR